MVYHPRGLFPVPFCLLSSHHFAQPDSTMKTELCHFSGYKIHPGRGIRTVRIDGKTLVFLNHKCQQGFLRLHRNPREIRWTVLYRRKYKKGQQEEVAKKRVRRVKPEVRKAQRDEAIKAAKDKFERRRPLRRSNRALS
ncbi:putative 60S ribosomal protein L24 [Hypsibius exemplaris]|uniref:Large ribosomal subunit protein eL24 n=1 Tax=Hypsibius exemplaris TaxID=2072580 RepID=A0A1W0WG54_HYPEX|nr:putative 60S ribosomal protein L24 [Hypsibius exemplaris]